jgi:hypothetical protein
VPEVIAGYRSQSEAEFSFRQMKDPHVVSFPPMHHWTEHSIRVHAFTCVLALQTAHLMRRKAGPGRPAPMSGPATTYGTCPSPSQAGTRTLRCSA